MTKRSPVRLIATLCAFLFLVTAGAMSRPAAAQSCDGVTDAQIVAGIYAKIKVDKNLKPQISHINVVAVFAAVKLQGWANSRSDHEKIVAFAMETNCVKMVNVNLFAETPPADGDALKSQSGCAPGTKPCGDICIPESDPCNLMGELGIVDRCWMDRHRGFGSCPAFLACRLQRASDLLPGQRNTSFLTALH